jgi:hypothetical protein
MRVSVNPGMLRRQMFHRHTSSGKDQMSGSATRKLETRNSQSTIRALQQPGYMKLPMSRDALTRVPKRPKSEGLTKLLQRHRNSVKPWTYREALIMATNKRAL